MFHKIKEAIAVWWEQFCCPHDRLVYVGVGGKGRELTQHWHLHKCEDCGIIERDMNAGCTCREIVCHK